MVAADGLQDASEVGADAASAAANLDDAVCQQIVTALRGNAALQSIDLGLQRTFPKPHTQPVHWVCTHLRQGWPQQCMHSFTLRGDHCFALATVRHVRFGFAKPHVNLATALVLANILLLATWIRSRTPSDRPAVSLSSRHEFHLCLDEIRNREAIGYWLGRLWMWGLFGLCGLWWSVTPGGCGCWVAWWYIQPYGYSDSECLGS